MAQLIDNRNKSNTVAYINVSDSSSMDELIAILQSGNYTMEVFSFIKDGETKESIAIKPTTK